MQVMAAPSEKAASFSRVTVCCCSPCFRGGSCIGALALLLSSSLACVLATFWDLTGHQQLHKHLLSALWSRTLHYFF